MEKWASEVRSTNQNQLQKLDCIIEVRSCVTANKDKEKHGQEFMVKNSVKGKILFNVINCGTFLVSELNTLTEYLQYWPYNLMYKSLVQQAIIAEKNIFVSGKHSKNNPRKKNVSSTYSFTQNHGHSVNTSDLQPSFISLLLFYSMFEAP